MTKCDQCHVPTNNPNRLRMGGHIMRVCEACWTKFSKIENLFPNSKPYSAIQLKPARDIREK